MGISSINLAYGASYGAYSQKLTQSTRQKLEVLGIPFNQNITEEEGKRLIKAHEAQKRENANQQGMFQNPSNTNDLFEKAKKLAQKLGIQVPEVANFQQVISAIEVKLEQKLAGAKNNVAELKKLQGLSEELAFIQAQSNGSAGYDATNQALMTSLEMLSEYNKNFLKH